MADMKNCPYCGKLTDLSLKNCPHCGGPFQAKAPETPGLVQPAVGNSCPICKAKIQDGDIICVRCGTNLLTGEKVVAPAPVKVTAGGEGSRWPLAVAVLLVCLLAAGGGAAYWLLRDPVALAVLEYKTGNPLQGIEILEKHVQHRGDDARALLTLGKMQWKSESYAQAAALFDKVSKAQPANTDAGLLAVVAQSRVSGDAERATQKATLERVAQHAPENLDAKYLLALSSGGDADPAAQAEALAEIAAAGGGGASQRQLGVARALQGDIEGAKTALEKAKASLDDGDTNLALGIVADAQGDSEGAVSLMTSALNKGAGANALAKLRLAVQFMKDGNTDGAMPLLNEIAAGQPATNPAVFFEALCLEAAGLDAEALTTYDKVANANGPYSADVYPRMAVLFAKQGNFDRAMETIKRAQDAGASSAYLYTLKGRIHFAANELAEAQEAFRNAIKSDPEYAPAHLENGLLYVKREVLSDGVKELERYLALVGDKREGTRANEIEVLLTQLRQTMGEQPASGAAS